MTDPLSQALGGRVEAHDLALQVALLPLERRVLTPQIVQVLAYTIVQRLQVTQVPLVILDVSHHRLSINALH